jgi:glycosyltransferase involved in cell wall biosynthesis
LTQSTVRKLFQELQRLERDASIESRGETIPRSGLEWLVWIGGSRPDVEAALSLTLEALHQSCRQETVTFLLDGSQTRQWGPVARYLPEFPNRREIALSRRTDLPALLYALGLRDSRASWATFLWPGCQVEPEAMLSLQKQADGADFAYGGFSTSVHPFAERARAGWVLGESAGWHVPPEVLHPVESGWLQMVDCVPMNGCLLSVPFAQRIGPFDVNPLLGCLFWWYATRRIAAAGRVAYAPASLPSARWNWDAFPFRTEADVPAELSVRFLTRPPSAECPSAEVSEAQIEAFANDLPSQEGRALALTIEAWGARIGTAGLPAVRERAAAVPTPRPPPFPIRVTVLGGPYEPHHDQLCFFNFFELASGQGYVSWKTLLYQSCRPADLDSSDLVVFSRPRYAECDDLLEACGRLHIPTLVMIDDNWIAAGREFSRYETLFTPGRPAFETFLRCLARSDATLVYNELLEEDLRPLAREVHRLPPNVDTSLFRAEGEPERPQGFLAGYAGSPRFETAPFRALAELARRHADVRLLAMAHTRPPEWAEVPGDRVLFVPFCVDYRRYARTIASLCPDVMVAPLDGSRFSASKCPNKFLELSAARTAGIYSKTKPYTEYVAPGRTGLLVDNTVDAWLEALEDLYGNPGRRAEIARQAHDEVLGRFDTSRVLPAFLDLLGRLAERTQPASIPPAARPT